MEELIPVLVVVAIVAFVVSKQIGQLTTRLDNVQKKGSFELYAKFSVAIQEHVRTIRACLDSTKTHEPCSYQLQTGKDEAKALEILSDFIRKLVFFETMLAKQKKPEEIEAELFELLSQLEAFLNEFCVEGEKLADELRESLSTTYEQLH